MSNYQESPEFTRMVVELMINAGPTGASYSKLAEVGIENPDAYVAQLRIDGAVIKKKRRTIITNGLIWEDCPHYIYKRWDASGPISEKCGVVSITDARPKGQGSNQ